MQVLFIFTVFLANKCGHILFLSTLCYVAFFTWRSSQKLHNMELVQILILDFYAVVASHISSLLLCYTYFIILRFSCLFIHLAHAPPPLHRRTLPHRQQWPPIVI